MRPRLHAGVLRTSLFALLMSPAVSYAQTSAQPDINRGPAYYHYALSRMYADMAASAGRQDYATQSIEEYKLALGADPTSIALLDGLPELYFSLGRIRDAVISAQEQVKLRPDDVRPHQLLGRIYLRSLGDQQGQQATDMLKLAISEYETIARLKPQDLETRLLLGQLYGLNHDSAKAEGQFKEAQKIDGTSEEVVLNMARLYTERGEMDKAAEALLSVPEDERSARTELALAGIYDQQKKFKESAEAYKRSLDQDPDNVDAKRGLANALMMSGKSAEAGKIYDDLSATDPQDAQSLIRAAETQRRAGHYEEALATLKKARALVSDDPALGFTEALTYDSLGRYDDAIHSLQGVLNSTTHEDGKYNEQELGNRALILDRMGIIYREAGKTAESAAAYKQMSALGGDYLAQGMEGQVNAFREVHAWPKALEVAATYAKDQPKNHPVQLLYVRQLADNGKLDEAIRLAEKQLSGSPEDRDVYYTIADIEIDAKRWKEASAQLDKAEALASKPEEKMALYFYRGRLADREKMHDQAETEFRKALAIDPQNALVQNYLGYMLADRGTKLPEAIGMLRKAVEGDPQNGAYLDSLGWAYYKSGQYALAEENLRKAAARSESDPAVLDHLGEVFEKNGKLKEAVQAWQKSLSLYATSLPADADPTDVAKVEHKLEGARIKLAKLGAGPAK